MIELKDKISSVSLNLFGNSILNGIQAKQENGILDDVRIPFEFKYNGSWKIAYNCSSCGEKVELGAVFSDGKVKRDNYILIKYLCSKYYRNQFLEIFPELFSNVDILVIEKNYYVIISGLFDKDFPITSSIEPVYCKCRSCKSEYLCRFRQGFPVEPEPSTPEGRLGTIFIDEIINIKVKEGDDFLNLINTYKK